MFYFEYISGVVLYEGSEEGDLGFCRIRQGLGSQPLDLVFLEFLSGYGRHVGGHEWDFRGLI